MQSDRVRMILNTDNDMQAIKEIAAMYARKAPRLQEDMIISEDLYPVQAIKDAMRLIEYAEAHSGHFTQKDRAAMKLCLDYLGRVSE